MMGLRSAAVALAALALVGALLAANAKADRLPVFKPNELAYLDAMARIGITDNPYEVLTVGYQICTELDRGHSGAELAQMFGGPTAWLEVDNAEAFLCPDELGR
jgi:hypothetical protein